MKLPKYTLPKVRLLGAVRCVGPSFINRRTHLQQQTKVIRCQRFPGKMKKTT